MVILICIPLTLPRLAGFDIYTVVTGSMEPAIPVGSLIYVREEAPAELMEGEVVAYRSDTDAGIIITHRVVKNQVVSGQLITKGDANEAEDISPVPLADLCQQLHCCELTASNHDRSIDDLAFLEFLPDLVFEIDDFKGTTLEQNSLVGQRNISSAPVEQHCSKLFLQRRKLP